MDLLFIAESLDGSHLVGCDVAVLRAPLLNISCGAVFSGASGLFLFVLLCVWSLRRGFAVLPLCLTCLPSAELHLCSSRITGMIC